jgi:hypothetical protein
VSRVVTARLGPLPRAPAWIVLKLGLLRDGSRPTPGLLDQLPGRLARLALGAPLQVRELTRLHNPVRRFPEEEIRDPLEEPRSGGRVAADHEPRATLRPRLQLETPQGVDVEARPRPRRVEGLPAVQVDRRSQPQEALGLERCDLEPRGAARCGGQAIPDRQRLPLSMDPLGTRDAPVVETVCLLFTPSASSALTFGRPDR